MSDRLLTDEELASFFRGSLMRDESVEGYLHRVRDSQDAKTEPLVRADERRKMAEWLDKTIDMAVGPDIFVEWVAGLSALREGRAPWS